MAFFDAGTPEFEMAKLMDRDPDTRWWLRLSTNGQAYIPTPEGRYFPDFVALDSSGTLWLIEGKANDSAKDTDVLRKIEAAQTWARAARDEEEFGTWRYMFATESDIKQAAGSWKALLTSTKPE